MSDPLSTEARRHVRLVREALREDLRGVFRVLTGVDLRGDLILNRERRNRAMMFFVRRLQGMRPHSRRTLIEAHMKAMRGDEGASCIAHLSAVRRGHALTLRLMLPFTDGHPFDKLHNAEGIEEWAYAEARLMCRKDGDCDFESLPLLAISPHVVGRIFERKAPRPSVSDTCGMMRRIGFFSYHLGAHYDEDDEVYLALGEGLVAVGRVRVGGFRKHGVVTFVDWRTALHVDMLDAHAKTFSLATIAWGERTPQEWPAARKVGPDWIERYLRGEAA